MTTRPSTGKPGKPDAGGATNPREARLKAALKANLARRKAQARKRADGSAGQDTPDPQKD